MDDVIPVVEALAALRAPSTPHVIAQQLDTSYKTDGRFRTRLGAAGYYGFIEKQSDRRVLTPRGEAVSSDDDAAVRQAKREAVMSSNFGALMHSLRGGPMNENTIALRLQSDYRVPEASAPSIAKVLVASATQAELVTDNRFDAAAIESLAAVIPAQGEAQKTNGTGKGTVPERSERPPRAGSDATTTTSSGKKLTEVQTPPFVPSVQVVLKIDVTTLTPQEIAELVRELQKTTPE